VRGHIPFGEALIFGVSNIASLFMAANSANHRRNPAGRRAWCGGGASAPVGGSVEGLRAGLASTRPDIFVAKIQEVEIVAGVSGGPCRTASGSCLRVAY